jgi:glycosyltransferase involved in cell wall biosynthesis
VTGFLVPGAVPAALAEKIVLLVQDAQLRRELGGHGRKRLEQKFSLQRMVEQTRKVYQDLLDWP